MKCDKFSILILSTIMVMSLIMIMTISTICFQSEGAYSVIFSIIFILSASVFTFCPILMEKTLNKSLE